MDETFIPPPESLISLAEWQQTPASVQQWVIDLCAKNNQLRETVEVCRNSLTGTCITPRNHLRKIAPSRNPPGNRQARRVNGVDNLVTPVIIGRWWTRWMKWWSTSRSGVRSVAHCY